jgi:beta-lactamase class A
MLTLENIMKKNVILIILIISLTFSIIWNIIHYQKNTAPEADFKKCSSQYPLISSELDCGTINEKIEQVEDIDKKIEDLTNKEEQAHNAQQISVFFRDLNSRRWFGVNENVNFYPASLAKLPMAMMFYKTAEVNKKILDIPLAISAENIKTNEGQHYIPQESLENGKFYPIKELLRRILIFSDNAPIDPLMRASDSFRTSILTDLGIFFEPESAKDEDGSWNINAKNYANLFRILFNASYIRPEYSNEILDQLSQSTFKNALAAGVPEGIRVAHKYGEMSHLDAKSQQKSLILNDCGIIYKKDHPYILCIMTQGDKLEELERIIREISKTVYDSSSL